MLKTTGHLTTIALLVTGLLTSPAAGATEIKLRTSNDFLSDPNQSDDLYTAEIGLGFRVGAHGELELGERIFTDRERGLRFDESYVRYTRELHRRHLDLRVGAGLVVLGHGAGESLQNSIHRLIGGTELELDYVDDEEWFATAELWLSRALLEGRYGTLAASLDVQAAPGFRSWLATSLDLTHQLGPVDLSARVGYALHEVEFEPLAPRIAASSPSWSLGAAVGRLSVQWSYNHYGTQSKHVELAYRLRWSPPRRGHRPPDIPLASLQLP